MDKKLIKFAALTVGLATMYFTSTLMMAIYSLSIGALMLLFSLFINLAVLMTIGKDYEIGSNNVRSNTTQN